MGVFLLGNFLIAALIIFIQIGDSYLRWLAFSHEFDSQKNWEILRKTFIWSGISLFFYSLIFYKNGIQPLTYKLILMFGEFPQIIIFYLIVRGDIFRHIFICNLVALWVFMIHSASALITTNFFKIGFPEEEIIFIYLEICLTIFLIILPLSDKLFNKIVPPQEFFKIFPHTKFLVMLPAIIMSAHFIRLSDDNLIHSLEERISRLYLPFVFIFFYKYMMIMTKKFYVQKNFEIYEENAKEKIKELSRYNKFLMKMQKTTAIMRHDMRHAYRLIYALIKSGEIKKAEEFIKRQKNLLESVKVRQFSESELINNILTIYLDKSEEVGIKINLKIDLKKLEKTSEKDLGILIVEIMERAIKNEEGMDKKINLMIKEKEGKIKLEIDSGKNFIGEKFLKNFLEKYSAEVSEIKLRKKIKFTMSWSDE